MGRPTLRTSIFADWLKSQRGDRSLEEVARRARKAVGGVIAFDRSSWNKLEEGQLPNVIQLWGIAKALDVPVLDLMRRVLQDLEVPVDQAATLRPSPPIAQDAQVIARRYQNADAARRNAVRLILEGTSEQAKVTPAKRQSGDWRKRQRVLSAGG